MIITWLALFAILITYRYIMDLRQEVKRARAEAVTAWKIYETTNALLCGLQGKPVPASNFLESKPGEESGPPRAFHPAPAYGPTATAAREELRAASRTPSPTDVASAATEATTNGNRT